jgi:hypothetical protein
MQRGWLAVSRLRAPESAMHLMSIWSLQSKRKKIEQKGAD